MDGKPFSSPGKCPACGMTLVTAQQLQPSPSAPLAGEIEVTFKSGGIALSGTLIPPVGSPHIRCRRAPGS